MIKRYVRTREYGFTEDVTAVLTQYLMDNELELPSEEDFKLKWQTMRGSKGIVQLQKDKETEKRKRMVVEEDLSKEERKRMVVEEELSKEERKRMKLEDELETEKNEKETEKRKRMGVEKDLSTERRKRMKLEDEKIELEKIINEYMPRSQ
ncbi:stress response protein NST1-like isoform X1 [Pecten maximus]|uniref:stress response protein NST1-like isoform X1 n=1 Tax=Pecten maximus TaxID=6579 RepID=UPI001458212D|nr:stress response protein NST1-like isoform X1 [Pecten maximus]